MDKYAEWCSKVNHRAGCMVRESELPLLETSGDAGFRSVYLFSEESAKAVSAAGSSKLLSQCVPHSTTLFIDCDDGQASVPRVLEFLKDTGTAATLYTSGGKGVHVHIPITAMEGRDTPYSQSVFTAKIGIAQDSSIYRVSSLIALPGRVHPKTGKRKALMTTVVGGVLTVPRVQKPGIVDFSGFVESETTFERVVQRLYSAVVSPPRSGNRYLTLWQLAKTMAEAGVTPRNCYGFLQEVNRQWPVPKETGELERAVREAYGSAPST